MAVRQGYYRYYLDYLSDLGYLIYSFDFSGIDKSKSEKIKGSEITMHDWISELNSATNWILENYQDHLSQNKFEVADDIKKYYLCHSLGGQFFGFIDNQNKFEKFIGITSQNGYWRFYKNKRRYFFFWYFLEPVLTNLFGYFPGSKVGFGEDVPPEVMKRWKKWCTSKNYFFDDNEFSPQYDKYTGQMLTLGFEDDPWATQPAIDDLYDHYGNADREHWHIDPQSYNLDEIGHMGFFRPKCIGIWKKSVEWLETS